MKRSLILILILCDVAAAVHIMQTSFSGGEISPLVAARVDSERYFQSAETLENLVCIPQGPAIRRPGTRYVATAPGIGMLVPFTYATDDATALELTHEQIRFYRDGGLVVDANDDPYSLETVFDANDLAQIQTWQSADVMYLVDGVHPPQKLSRYGHTNWTIEDVPFTGGPFLTENATDVTIANDATVPDDYADGYIDGGNSARRVLRATWAAQTFTPDANYAATHIRLKLYRQLYPGTMTVSIRGTDANEPDGPDLASGTMEIGETVTTSETGNWNIIELSEAVELTAGTMYAIVIRCPYAGMLLGLFDEEVYWKRDSSGTYAAGKAYISVNSGSTWSEEVSGEADFLFAVLGMLNEEPSQTVTLTASDDVFDPNHVGSLWRLRTLVPQQQYTDILDANEPARAILLGPEGQWTLTTTGTWEALLLVEASNNTGYSWDTIARVDGNVTDMMGVEELENVMVRVRMTDYNDGSCTATLRTNKHYSSSEFYITDVNDPCTATATVRSSFAIPGATTRWSEGAWSTYRGWPSVIASYADRLVFASTAHQPVTTWFSKMGHYETFRSGTLDADSFGYKLLRTGQDRILWVSNYHRKGLMIGTAADVVEIQPTFGSSISASDLPSVVHSLALPCASIRPIAAESTLLVVQRGARKLRELAYEYQSDSLLSPDLTLFASHATGAGITQMAWTMHPYPILWAVRTDGVLAGMTYDRNYQVVGWHRHTFDGAVRSVASIPSANQDRLWLLVQRTVDANTVYHVEYLADWQVDTLDAAYFVDSGLTWAADPNTGGTVAAFLRTHVIAGKKIRVTTSSPHGFDPNDPNERVAFKGCDGATWLHTSWPIRDVTDTTFFLADEEGEYFSASNLPWDESRLPPEQMGATYGSWTEVFAGLDHLAGMTVAVVADGNAVGDFVVDPNGVIDINEPALYAHAGLPYTSTLKTVRYDFNAESGPTWPRRKAMPNVTINFLDTAGALWVGSEALMPVEMTGLFTGDVEVHLPTTYGLSAQLSIVADAPMPMTVRAVAPELEIRR